MSTAPTYLTAPIAESRESATVPRSGWARDGYTRRSGAATHMEIRLEGEKRWRRVMIWCFSNSGTLFVRIKGVPHIVRSTDLPAKPLRTIES